MRSTILAFVVGATLVAGFTFFHVSRSYQSELEYWVDRQSSVANDRASAVSSFLLERQADAEILVLLPVIERFILQPSAGSNPSKSPALARLLVSLLDRFSTVYEYRGIYVMDAKGNVISQSSSAPNPGPETLAVARRAIVQGNSRIELLGESPQDSILAISAPIISKGDEATPSGPPRDVLGVAVLELSASRSLFPLLTARLLPTRTGETVILRRKGKEAVYLSPLRSVPVDLPFSHHSLDVDGLAARALGGGDYAGEMTDYRGEPVIVATRQIPRTGWGLVRTIDRREALDPFYRRALIEGLLGVLIILGYGAILRGYWRGQEARGLQAKVEQQQRLLKVTEYA